MHRALDSDRPPPPPALLPFPPDDPDDPEGYLSKVEHEINV